MTEGSRLLKVGSGRARREAQLKQMRMEGQEEES